MNDKKCISCNGKLKQEIVDYQVYGKTIGKFPAFVCKKCKEQWFSEETSKKIEKAEKDSGTFGLSVETNIGYSGNSLIIRIPKQLAKFMDIKKETRVILYPENKDKLCITIK